jgi:hypothetical protein
LANSLDGNSDESNTDTKTSLPTRQPGFDLPSNCHAAQQADVAGRQPIEATLHNKPMLLTVNPSKPPRPTPPASGQRRPDLLAPEPVARQQIGRTVMPRQ